MKKTVAIGIPVLNEERSLNFLLPRLLKQDFQDYDLTEIVILSDGSTDCTEAIVETYAVTDSRITLIKGTTRKGKPARINELFMRCQADVLIVLDGDIRIKSNHTLRKLVMPILSGRAHLTSGKAEYLPPQTFFESVMKTGIDMWTDVKTKADHNEMYTCEGQIRAFAKELYKKLRFPNFSADDVYPYLYCKQHHLSYVYVPEARVYYGLPSTLTDYRHQHTRYLHSRDIQRQQFTTDLINSTYVIGTREKLSACLNHLTKHPLRVSLYSLFLVLPKVEVHFDGQNTSALWTRVSTTKK